MYTAFQSARSDQTTPPGLSRDRRVGAEELDRLIRACASNRTTWLPTVISLAVETGMRRSELLAMEWVDLDLGARTIRLTKTKNGHPRTVPLSSIAVRLLMDVPRTEARVFPITANAFRLAWEQVRRRAG